MLARCQRLSTAEFAGVFENGTVVRHPLLQVRVLRRDGGKPDGGNEVGRAAFVAPKKLGKAVVRNRLRRCVRERYRLLQSDLSAECSAASCDLVFIIGAAAQGASTLELESALRELLKRAARSGKKIDHAKTGYENRKR